MRRVIVYRNSFLPLISGCVMPEVGGSKIEMVLRVSAPVAAVTALLAVAAIAGGIVGVWGWLQTADAHALLALLVPAVAIVIVVVGYFPEKRQAIKLLSQALDAAPVRTSRSSSADSTA
jgi:hypothetical protein